MGIGNQMSAANLNPEGKVHGEILTEISDGMVRLLKEYYGTGPSETKTIYDDDLVLCILRGRFTQVENTLNDSGHEDVVAQLRHAFQKTMAPMFQDLIERATGRKVIAFMSGNQNGPDMLGEMFVLEPRQK